MKPIKESKRDRFVRVAEARTAKIISMIRLLGNCSNKAVYEYQAKDLKKIFGPSRFREKEYGRLETGNATGTHCDLIG